MNIVSEIKEQFIRLIKNLGYNITDNVFYEENFPWLILKTDNYQTINSLDTIFENVVLRIDIFSNYAGEKEILDIVEDIRCHLDELRIENQYITQIFQSNLKIIDDKTKGPVNKHGIALYNVILTRSKENNDGSTGN